MGEQCFAQSDDSGLFVIAAKGNGKKVFAIVNDTKNEKEIELSVNGAELDCGRVKAIDETHTFDEIDGLDKTVVLPPFSVRYVEF